MLWAGVQNDAKHFQPSGIHTFKSLKTMLCKSPFARLGTLVLLFSIFQNCWSTQFALLVQLFFKREFPLHWHLINIAVGWNAVGNNASAHSVRFWKFFHSSPKCFVIRIFVSKHYALQRRDCAVLHSWRMVYIIWKLENSSFQFIKIISTLIQILK